MKSKKLLLLLLTVTTLNTNCGVDEKFGETSCFVDRIGLINDATATLKHKLESFCDLCSENCAMSAEYTTEYLNILKSWKKVLRENPGNCTEENIIELEFAIDDKLAYYGDFLERYKRCSK